MGTLKLSRTEKAYIAGLFDGDGCVCIGLLKPLRYALNHYLIVGITNKDLSIMKWLKRKLHGGIVSHKEYGKNDWYVWRLKSSLALELLQQIYPYLKIKKKRAKLAIEFQLTKQHITKSNRLKELRKRDKYRIKISNLNSSYKQIIPITMDGDPVGNVQLR